MPSSGPVVTTLPRPSLRREAATAASAVKPLAAAPTLGPGILHLRPPAAATGGKLEAWLRRARRPCARRAECLSIALAEAHPEPFLAALAAQLTPPERGATRVLFQPAGRDLALPDYLQMQSLDVLLARPEAAWLTSVMDRQAFAMHFQPIVRVAPQRALFAYECLMRGRAPGPAGAGLGDSAADAACDAGLIPPHRLLAIARRADLTGQLDAAARRAALRAAAHHRPSAKVFVNFTAAAIYDPAECLRETLEQLAELGLDRSQFVFEAVEGAGDGEADEDLGHLRALLECFRAAGLQVALDDLGPGRASLRRLEHLSPDYVKLDREIITGVDRDPCKAIIAARLLATAQALGVATVVEGVETRAEFDWARDHGADFAQGFFIARPACPPPLV